MSSVKLVARTANADDILGHVAVFDEVHSAATTVSAMGGWAGSATSSS